MKKHIFKIFSILFCGIVAIGCVSRGKPANNGDNAIVEFADYNEKLLVGFDTQSEIMANTMGQKEIREYKVVTDEKYVTQGTGALKITHDSEENYNSLLSNEILCDFID